jgi:orotate phosphoribosyltransferase
MLTGHISSEDILKIFKETGALLEGHFLLTSGLHSPKYFQCAKVFNTPNMQNFYAGKYPDTSIQVKLN